MWCASILKMSNIYIGYIAISLLLLLVLLCRDVRYYCVIPLISYIAKFIPNELGKFGQRKYSSCDVTIDMRRQHCLHVHTGGLSIRERSQLCCYIDFSAPNNLMS